MQIKLLKTGDRVINLAQLTHAAYGPAATNPAVDVKWSELALSFANCDDCALFYGSEADRLWEVIQLHSFNLDSAKTVALKPID